MSVITLTQADQGKSITLQPGQTLVVELPENPTTGFRWAIARNDEETLALRKSDYKPAAGVGVGGGGRRTFTFIAKKPGSVVLQFKNWRKWEGDSSVTRRFGVIVDVGG
ncbi:MAG: protease inhibitor I42 family protein [Candidatus Competibacteraceae bacterium]